MRSMAFRGSMVRAADDDDDDDPTSRRSATARRSSQVKPSARRPSEGAITAAALAAEMLRPAMVTAPKMGSSGALDATTTTNALAASVELTATPRLGPDSRSGSGAGAGAGAGLTSPIPGTVPTTATAAATTDKSATAAATSRGSGDAAAYSGGSNVEATAKAAQTLQRWWRRTAVKRGLRAAAEKPTDKAMQLAISAQMMRASKNKIRKQLNEICIYVIFLICFTASSILVVQDQRIFHMTSKIERQMTETEFLPIHSHVLKTFDDIETVQEFTQWLLGPFRRTVYETNRGYPGTIFGVDHIIGGVRMSQLRVRPTACESWHDMRANDATRLNSCYGEANNKGAFGLDVEDRQAFGTNGRTFTWAGNNAHLYKSIEHEREGALADMSYRSRFANKYPNGAFPVILPNSNVSQATDLLMDIIDGGYIDLQTRVVFAELTVFNPQMDYYSHIAVICETEASGGVQMSFAIDTVRLYTLVESSTGSKIWILEVVVALFYIYYWVHEVLQIRKAGFRSYFSKIGNVMHNANLIMFIFMWIFRLLALMSVPDAEDVIVDSDVFYSYHAAAAFKSISVYANSFNAFLCWFKLVRFLSYIPQFAIVTGTLSKAASGVSGFIIIFCVVMYGFSAAHLLAFGSRIKQFRNMTQSCYSLLVALLGSFDFEQLEEAQFFMGPLLFIVFISVAVFVVLNTLIAIISDAYNEQRLVLMETDDVELGQEMKDYMVHVLLGLPVVGPMLRKANSRRQEIVRGVKKSLTARPTSWHWRRSSSIAQEGAETKTTPRRRGLGDPRFHRSLGHGHHSLRFGAHSVREIGSRDRLFHTSSFYPTRPPPSEATVLTPGGSRRGSWNGFDKSDSGHMSPAGVMPGPTAQLRHHTGRSPPSRSPAPGSDPVAELMLGELQRAAGPHRSVHFDTIRERTAADGDTQRRGSG